MATFSISIDKAVLPVANDDFYSVYPNSVTIFNVLDNDFLGMTPTIINIEINPINGVVVIIGTTIQYTSTIGYVGADSFYYKITDNNGDTDIAKVNIEIG